MAQRMKKKTTSNVDGPSLISECFALVIGVAAAPTMSARKTTGRLMMAVRRMALALALVVLVRTGIHGCVRVFV